MKLATWNVNSVRVREERLLRWLDAHEPDVLCLQELKVVDEKFPQLVVKEHGYYSLTHGQKTYNGVAILTKSEPKNVIVGFDDGDEEDAQARLISAEIDGVNIISAYFPNGSSVESDKYVYKKAWMKRLRALLDRRYSKEDSVALCGDFNVAPFDDDIAFLTKWAGSTLVTDEIRARLEDIRAFGLEDVFRKYHPDGAVYSWWDYRMLGFPKGNGLRIDHIYATASLAARSTGAYVDRDERKGKQPSDHAPVVVEFS